MFTLRHKIQFSLCLVTSLVDKQSNNIGGCCASSPFNQDHKDLERFYTRKIIQLTLQIISIAILMDLRF